MLSIGKMGAAQERAGDYYLNLAREDYYTRGGEPPGLWRGLGAEALGLSAGRATRTISVRDDNEQRKVVQDFQSEFESNKKGSPVLIVNSASAPDTWTIAGFNDEGQFKSVLIDDPSDQLSVELEKESASYGKIAELAATRLGRTLSGRVTNDQLWAVLSGVDPAEKRYGQPLVQNAGPQHQSGWDLTFSAPKSVSVLWSQADANIRTIVQESQQAAVDTALGFVEEHAAYARRGKGGVDREPVKGLVIATFEHSTSREQDPQLHTHSLIANLAQRQDGSWGSLFSRPLYQWKMAAGAVYRAELAEQLKERLAVDIQRDKRSFRLFGIPRPVEKAFSKRSDQIAEYMHKLGYDNAAGRALAALRSRQHKDLVKRPELFKRWREEGKSLGFGAEKLHELLRDSPRGDPLHVPTPPEILAELTSKHSTFSESDLWRAAAESLQGLTDLEGIEEFVTEIKNHPEHVKLHRDERFTTREMLHVERRMVETAKSMATTPAHQVSERCLTKVLKGYNLTHEQATAVAHITRGSGDVACVIGMAGTGKSYALDAARAAWEAQGFRVTGAALAGKAARGLLESAHIPSHTLHSLFAHLDTGNSALTSKDVLVVDEAGMVGSRHMDRVLQLTKEAGAKLVLVGDPDQLQPVDAGAAFKAITQRLGAPYLTDIQRQNEPWARMAVGMFARGRALLGLTAYHQHGLLHVSPDRDAAKQAMVRAWYDDDPNQDANTLLLAFTKQEVRQLNELARQMLKTKGRLQDGATIKTAHGSREFALEERVLFTKNSVMYGVRNGDLGVLERIAMAKHGATFHVRLDTGSTVGIPLRHYDHLDHGYAVTTHKAQGATVDRAYVLTGGEMVDRELTYVQMSRHRDFARIFVDRVTIDERLAEASPTPSMVAYARALALVSDESGDTRFDGKFQADLARLNAWLSVSDDIIFDLENRLYARHDLAMVPWEDPPSSLETDVLKRRMAEEVGTRDRRAARLKVKLDGPDAPRKDLANLAAQLGVAEDLIDDMRYKLGEYSSPTPREKQPPDAPTLAALNARLEKEMAWRDGCVDRVIEAVDNYQKNRLRFSFRPPASPDPTAPALPPGYDSNFVVCRDFLNRHAKRRVDDDPVQRDLRFLSTDLARSRQKTVTLDYLLSGPQKQKGLDRPLER